MNKSVQRARVVRGAAWFAALLLFAAMALLLRPQPAAAQQGNSFDHQTTGFSLTGKHEDVRCETCHIKGIFKGTPRDCQSCHVPNNQRGALAKSNRHIPSTATCDSCHSTSSFAAVLFSHAGVSPGTCATCHDNVRVVGKPASHIPTTATCDACHSTAAFLPVKFFDHQAANFGNYTCTTCHDGHLATGKPANHVPTLAASKCETCHQASVSGGFKSFSGGVMDHTGYAVTGCAQCHAPSVANSFFGLRIVSSAGTAPPHLPTSDSCEACHANAIPAMPIPATGAAGVGGTTFAGGRMVHTGITTNCALCHGPNITSASFLGVTPKTNAGLVPPHMPTTAACEACHANAIPAMPIPAAGAAAAGGTTFGNGQMSHSGITNNCAACHGPGIGAASFFGITSIVVLPPTSPAGPGSHIPSSSTCESCHLGSTPAGLVPANAAKTAPGTAFATPVPTTAQIHAGITGGCNACHETASMWMGMASYPIAPTTLSAGAKYTGFQTRPIAAASTYSVADPAHPATGDCSQCHSGTNFFDGQLKPANHIPYAANAQCNACHTNPDFSVLPSLQAIHANAQSTTANCGQCHGAAAASFAIPAANFSIVGLPGNHVPTSASCELCHVGANSSIAVLPVPDGAKFTNSAMSHAGVTTNCAACHGPGVGAASFAGITKIVVLPPVSPPGPTSHIPSSTTCETCHLGSTPTGLVPGNASKTAPGTAFAAPVPTTAQIHTGITGGCSGCHEASYVWMGMAGYPIAPTTLTNGAQYTGFQTRPIAAASTYSVADAAHPATGDCSQCHSGTNFFTAQDKPANHIPYAASAQCAACHTGPDFSVLPTLQAIHANAQSTTANCGQCHGAAAASFAIPAANFSIVGLPGNHVPTNASCEACHVGANSSIAVLPVPNGAKFTNSAMSHAGITTNCAACHGPSIGSTSFAGITKIVVLPPVSPPGPTSHIPSNTTCETCHLGSTPTGLVPGNASKTAPGTAFAAPVPTTAQIHTGITGGCNACHEAGYVWMGMASYPISPTTLSSSAQYIGFHTRPLAAASTYSVADAAHPSTGDCSECHSGTNYFSAQAKPTGHMPTTQACATCHVSAGDFSVAGLTKNLTTMHTGIASGCAACHTAGAGGGPFAGCTTQASCTSPPPLSYQPKVMPLAAGGSPTAPSTQTHVPVGSVPCEKCHSPTVFSSFTGMNMKGSTPAHTAVSAQTCISCHEGTPQYTWFGVTIVTRPVGHQGRKTGQDCVGSGCHNNTYNQFNNAALMRPVLRSAVTVSSPRLLPDALGLGAPAGAVAGPFNHQGVAPGQCQTCHNGQLAKGQPARHLVTRLSCDSCHRNTAWTPAQFNHQGSLAGQCQACHNGSSAAAKPAGHFFTARSCDACHRTLGWVPVSYSHMAPGYRAQPDKPTCVSCHITNGEIIPRQLRGGPRPRPIPVGPGG